MDVMDKLDATFCPYRPLSSIIVHVVGAAQSLQERDTTKNP